MVTDPVTWQTAAMRFVVPALLVLGAHVQGAALPSPVVPASSMPDPRKTPGGVLTTDPRVICAPDYVRSVKTISQSLKAQVFRSYGVVNPPAGNYQIDHLIPLELGGSRGLSNLWPQSYGSVPVNATTKDRLEARLRRLACDGTISFQTARQAIAGNWQAAYVRYVGPLPGGVKPARGAAAAVQVPAMPERQVNASRVATKVVAGTGILMPTTARHTCPLETPVKINALGRYYLPNDRATYVAVQPVLCVSSGEAARSAGFLAP